MMISLTAFLAYAATVIFACATPGPAMFAVISTGIARGRVAATRVAVAISLGDLALIILTLVGLSALAELFGWVFNVIKYGGAAYLIYLGVKMWRAAPAALAEGQTQELREKESVSRGKDFGLGFAIALGNPKAILFHASLIPIVLDLAHIRLETAVLIAATAFTLNLAVMLVYAAMAASVARYFRTPTRARWLNRIVGSTLIGTGAVVAAR